MQSFTYKPALLRGAVVYEITEQALVCRTPQGGVNWRIDWDQIQSAAFVDQKFRGNDIRRLDLITSTGKRSIAFSGLSGNARGTPNSAAHLELMAAILRKLETQTENFSVIMGEYGRGRTVMFVIGIFTLLSGGGLIALAAATGVSTDKLMDAAAPAGVMLLFGAVLCYKNRPVKTEVTLPAGLLANALDGTLDSGKTV